MSFKENALKYFRSLPRTEYTDLCIELFKASKRGDIATMIKIDKKICEMKESEGEDQTNDFLFRLALCHDDLLYDDKKIKQWKENNTK